MTTPWTLAGGLTSISEVLASGEFRRFAPATVKINHVLSVLRREYGVEVPERFGPALGHVESTPEACFLWHFCQRLNATPNSNGTVTAGALTIAPQFVWDRYRLDFLITSQQLALCVEIDGLTYHGRTIDDIEADYRRQREIVANFCPVMRFVACEIADVARCWAMVDTFFTRWGA